MHRFFGIEMMCEGSATPTLPRVKGVLQLLVRVLYYNQTTIISIEKNRPQMVVLPIVRDLLDAL